MAPAHQSSQHLETEGAVHTPAIPGNHQESAEVTQSWTGCVCCDLVISEVSQLFLAVRIL